MLQRLMLVGMGLAILTGTGIWCGLLGRDSTLPVRLAINPWPGYGFLSFARDRGLFATYGLNLQLVEFSALGDELHAYLAEDVDGMACTQVEVVMAARYARPGRPQTVLVVDESQGADVILAAPGCVDVAALRGRRIAVEPASLNLFVLFRALEKQGIPLEAVVPVVMGQEAMPAALARKEIDAAVSYPPYSLTMMSSGAKPLFTSREIPGEVVDVITFTPAVLKRNPDLPQRLRTMWAALLAEYERDPKTFLADMARHQQVSPESLRQSLEGLRLIPGPEQERLLAPGGPVERSENLIHHLVPVRSSVSGSP